MSKTANQNYEPFTVKVNGALIEIKIESDGRGADRYYFENPMETEGSGKNRRQQRVRNKSKDIIAKRAEDVLKAMAAGIKPLTREEYEALMQDSARLKRLIRQLDGTNMEPETVIGQVVPTMQLLLPEGVTLARALEDGKSFHVPRTPMSLDEIADGLSPLIATNSSSKHVTGLKSFWEPLRIHFQGRKIHSVKPQEPDPRNHHGPRLNAAHPVNPLLRRRDFQEVVERENFRLVDQAFDRNRPAVGLEVRRLHRDLLLVRGELVEIVVMRDVPERGLRLVHGEARIIVRCRKGELLHTRNFGRVNGRAGPCADGIQLAINHARRHRAGGEDARADKIPAVKIHRRRRDFAGQDFVFSLQHMKIRFFLL